MAAARPLGDAPERSYVRKLEAFAKFAEPELRRIFAGFGLGRDAVVLDLGCGAGLTTAWLREASDGLVVGADLSRPHLVSASAHHSLLVQADAGQPCFREGSFDLIWACNTVNHLTEPAAALARLGRLLRGGGRLVLAQSGFLPDMFFAWDAPLEDSVRTACHRFYRERYGLTVEGTAGVRGLLGLLRDAGCGEVSARTHVVERLHPLGSADRDYLQHAIFEGGWGERILPYLSPEERVRLRENIDPASARYCLDRRDFHHIQSLTVYEARFERPR
jgi:SAM-dependent methyltransferase